MTGCTRIAARIFSSPPQFPQVPVTNSHAEPAAAVEVAAVRLADAQSAAAA